MMEILKLSKVIRKLEDFALFKLDFDHIFNAWQFDNISTV